MQMATHSQPYPEGTGLSSTSTEEKNTIKFYNHVGGLSSTQAFSRIPAEFVDTPRFLQAPLTGTHPVPSLVANPLASPLLPSTPGVYLKSSAPAKTVDSVDGFVSSSAAYQFVSGLRESRGASETPFKEVKSSLGAHGLQTSRSSLLSTGYTACTGTSSLSCPLELPKRVTVENSLADSPKEAVAAVTGYQLPGPAVRKVLPMKEVGYCTDYHGRSRIGLQPSVTTVSYLEQGYPKLFWDVSTKSLAYQHSSQLLP